MPRIHQPVILLLTKKRIIPLSCTDCGHTNWIVERINIIVYVSIVKFLYLQSYQLIFFMNLTLYNSLTFIISTPKAMNFKTLNEKPHKYNVRDKKYTKPYLVLFSELKYISNHNQCVQMSNFLKTVITNAIMYLLILCDLQCIYNSLQTSLVPFSFMECDSVIISPPTIHNSIFVYLQLLKVLYMNYPTLCNTLTDIISEPKAITPKILNEKPQTYNVRDNNIKPCESDIYNISVNVVHTPRIVYLVLVADLQYIFNNNPCIQMYTHYIIVFSKLCCELHCILSPPQIPVVPFSCTECDCVIMSIPDMHNSIICITIMSFVPQPRSLRKIWPFSTLKSIVFISISMHIAIYNVIIKEEPLKCTICDTGFNNPRTYIYVNYTHTTEAIFLLCIYVLKHNIYPNELNKSICIHPVLHKIDLNILHMSLYIICTTSGR